jgi:hypothetical protein
MEKRDPNLAASALQVDASGHKHASIIDACRRRDARCPGATLFATTTTARQPRSLLAHRTRSRRRYSSDHATMAMQGMPQDPSMQVHPQLVCLQPVVEQGQGTDPVGSYRTCI